MNICEKELLLGIQQKSKFRLYNFMDCVALIDIGNFRKHQEDSILVSERLGNTLMLVADGMGGLEDGAFASRMAAIDTYYWFQKLETHDFNCVEQIKEKYENFIEKLDIKIRNNCDGGTTMLLAIEVEDSVLCFNIGDSRAYIYDSLGNLKQATKDQSITQELYEEGEILSKDDMRFHKKNNLICSRVGCEKKLLTIEFQNIPKDEINDMFLFTDGVTDCISDEVLLNIISNDNEFVSKQILNYVMTNDSYSKLCSDDYYDKIEAGKDNVSIIQKKIRRK